MELLSFPFMQRALLAALLTGLMAPAIGSYIVQRRLSLLGDGLGHVAIAGVGLALMTGTAPLPIALAVAVTGAVIVELLRQNGRASGDVGLAILFYGGLASGVLMASRGGAGGGTLAQYLFGSLSTVTTADVAVVAGLAAVIITVGVGLGPQLFAVCADEDHARAMGLPVRWYSLLIVVLAAVAVTISMRTVGLLLVSALMVIPVAAAQGLVAGFQRSLLLAMAIGAVVTLGGTVGSFYGDTAPGALIVVLSIGVFLLSWPLSRLLRGRRRSPVEAQDGPLPLPHLSAGEHPHRHGAEDCDHPVVEHGEHRDYVHDGHRHAPHGDHYDEH